MNRHRPTRALAIGSLEALDERIVPAAVSITALPVATQEAFVTDRAGPTLGSVYTQYVDYEAAGASGTFTPTQAGQIYLSGTSVGVNLTFQGGNLATLIGQLQGIGMDVTATATQEGIVEGYLPISQLPVVASNGYATSIAPVAKPVEFTTAVTTTTTATQEAFVTTRAGASLGTLYAQYVSYEQAGASGTFTSTLSNQLYISGTSVGVEITFSGGDYTTLIGQLQGIGMDITATAPQEGIVEGYLPISQLSVIASNGFATSIVPAVKPTLR
jgi:hypothetical protein